MVVDLDMGVEYTFELRALGASRAVVGDLHGPSASITEMIADPDADPGRPRRASPPITPGPTPARLVWNVVTGTSYETRYTADRRRRRGQTG